MLSAVDVVATTTKNIVHKASQIWPEVYLLWFSMVGQLASLVTPYWSLTPSGYSGLWADCRQDQCVWVFEYGDPSHWLRCVQIVVCLALPLTVLSAIFLILASTRTNVNCSTPGGFASLTAGCMLLLGGGFYGYQQNSLSTIGWGLVVSVTSGCLCIFASVRMIVDCAKGEENSQSTEHKKPIESV